MYVEAVTASIQHRPGPRGSRRDNVLDIDGQRCPRSSSTTSTDHGNKFSSCVSGGGVVTTRGLNWCRETG